MKKAFLCFASLAMLTACEANSQRWQDVPYEPHYGDVMAPRADWADAESKQQDFNKKSYELQKVDGYGDADDDEGPKGGGAGPVDLLKKD